MIYYWQIYTFLVESISNCVFKEVKTIDLGTSVRSNHQKMFYKIAIIPWCQKLWKVPKWTSMQKFFKWFFLDSKYFHFTFRILSICFSHLDTQSLYYAVHASSLDASEQKLKWNIHFKIFRYTGRTIFARIFWYSNISFLINCSWK